jgi:hypothetical protein
MDKIKPIFDDNGKVFAYLNLNFVKKQGAIDNLDLIIEAFKLRKRLFQNMKPHSVVQDVWDIIDIEFILQYLLNLELNSDFHKFWEWPLCSCPIYDNIERWGTGKGYIYSHECLIHGYEK